MLGKVIIVLLIFLVLIIINLVVQLIHIEKEEDKACQELGFERDIYILGMNYCEDTQGNLHYIKMECKSWYWPECTAKTISVGDVRVR